MTDELISELGRIPFAEAASIRVILVGHEAASVAIVSSLTRGGDDWWNDPSVPAAALDVDRVAWSGIALRVPQDMAMPDVSSTDTLLEALNALGSPTRSELLGTNGFQFLLFFRMGDLPLLLWVPASRKIFAHTALLAGPNGMRRLDPAHDGLARRRVGIVGAGSVGSKLASSIVRSGVGRILLIDEDLLLPGNLVRHDLDWSSVGGHKADELAWRLRLIRPGLDVALRRTALTGQEASASVAAALADLTACDVIVDATADGAVFALVGGLAAERGTPMIWAEVLAGGIGGLVARFRPGHEPTPVLMRSRILAWCRGMDAPLPAAGVDYASTGNDGQPLIADDTDVTVIAAHAARLVLDTLLERAPSDFPHPAYFIGLRRAWIFREPFDTHPVDVGQPEETRSAGPIPPDVLEKNLAFLSSLLPDSPCAPDPTS